LMKIFQVKGIPAYTNSQLRNDFEWCRMTDAYLDSIYNAFVSDPDVINVDKSYLFFPWSRIAEAVAKQKPIEPVSVKLKSYYQKDKTLFCETVGDLKIERGYKMIVDKVFMLPSWKNLPISFVLGSTSDIFVIPMLDVCQTCYIHQNVEFGGTFENPIVVVNDATIPSMYVSMIIQ
jgi:hypothetical protein